MTWFLVPLPGGVGFECIEFNAIGVGWSEFSSALLAVGGVA